MINRDSLSAYPSLPPILGHRDDSSGLQVVSCLNSSGAGPEQMLASCPALPAGDKTMAEKPARGTANQRKPKARKFYRISWSVFHGLADFEVENLEVLSPGGWPLCPPEGRQGFPAYPEKPRVVIGKRKKGPPPSDIELYHSYWLISDRLKSLFEAVDPSAFAFQACDVQLRDGSPGPTYWLCAVTRILKPFGEPTLQAIEKERQRTGTARVFLYSSTVLRSLQFDENIVGESHIFITLFGSEVRFCDQVMKDACKAAGIRGVRFVDCFRK